jgi:hypothetical protein
MDEGDPARPPRVWLGPTTDHSIAVEGVRAVKPPSAIRAQAAEPSPAETSF